MPEVAKEATSTRESLIFSVAQQFVLLTIGAMMLDGGQFFQVVAYAALAYWGGFAIIMARRRHHLTCLDRLLIRWGYMILWVISGIVTGFIWHLRGCEL